MPKPSKKHRNVPPRFPGKRVSREEAEVQHRYGSLRITRDGRVRFSARTFLGLPELDFSAQYGTCLDDGSYVLNRTDYSIVANWPGKESFLMLSVARGRVESACFNYGLTPDGMREVVGVLRKAGSGLERWIIPGLEYTRDSIAQMMASPGAPRERKKGGTAMLSVIQELLDANDDLPVAEPWKKAGPTPSR